MSRPNRTRGTEAPPLKGREIPRYLWTQLTAMRTALWLLFALAVAAIPGSFLPQRPVSPIRVSQFVAANPWWGPLLDRLGFFDVFAAPWFAAVYLLLFVSLVGCILPRIWVYASQLRTPPPAVPASLAKLTGYRAGSLDATATDALDSAAAALRARRFRVRRESAEGSGGGTLSAEAGALREFGNLLFHLALVLLLCGLGWNNLAQYKGTAIVVVGQSFSNGLTQYDEFTAGAAFRPSGLTPFTLSVDDFQVSFQASGAAADFQARVTTSEGTKTLAVNNPIDIGGTEVHLLAHGYAPIVTVTDGNGAVAMSGPVVFLPQDAAFTSAGTIKAPDARPQRLAFEGIFLPTGTPGQQSFTSAFPDALYPELLLTEWQGPPKTETGVPENVFTLDTTGMTKLGDRARLRPGETAQIQGGGSIAFLGYQRWVKLQVSTNPGLWLVGVGVVLAVAGIVASLAVRPRQVFVRVDDGPGRTTVSLAGVDKVEGRPAVAADLAALARAIGLDPPETKEDP